MTTEHWQRDIEALEAHYSELVRQFGDRPEAVQYRDRDSHRSRFKILADVDVEPTAKVLDFGCGTAALLEYLRKERGFLGEYVGYDISAPMLDLAARKFPDARFERRNIFADGIAEEFDYVFISGVFNNRIADNRSFVEESLHRLFSVTRRALCFNMLSTYVDYFDENLYYASPEEVFRFCKEALSPRVLLRHDYSVREGALPFEFTVYVYASEIMPRRKLNV